MTHFNILVIVIRIAALLLVFNFLEKLPQHYLEYSSNISTLPENYFLITLVIPNLIMLIIAATLWFFPATYIGKLIPDNATIDYSKKDYEYLHVVLISVVGVYIFVYGLIDGAMWMTYYLHYTAQFRNMSEIPSYDYASMIATIIEVVMGLVLILGGKGISLIIRKTRGVY